MKWIAEIVKKKKHGEKIVMVTCYDAVFAKLIEQTEVDMILIGDSIAMTLYGFDSTIHATTEMMLRHTEAVRRGAPSKFIVTDMPFGTFRKGKAHAFDVAASFMRAGANAVKIEGSQGHDEVIAHLIGSGIPVMGHLGLTPQSVNQLGGYKVQGRHEEGKAQIRKDAKHLEGLGCFATVLECVPSALAAEITKDAHQSIIGIGAGSDVDGQVLVLTDLLGMDSTFAPKLAKRYTQLDSLIKTALNDYAFEVRETVFPTEEHCYD